LYTVVPDLQDTDKHVVTDTDVAAGDRRVDDVAAHRACQRGASAGALARAVHEHAAGTEAHEDAASGIQDDLAHIVGLPMVKTTSKAVVASVYDCNSRLRCRVAPLFGCYFRNYDVLEW
jgi:hypothetical protein